ncbi:MAG: rod shape-determining protein MreC [Gammaproteobacteria bacterium]|nr:rod shape-determining protein MreC [Gammaproteobacteria bacterium]
MKTIGASSRRPLFPRGPGLGLKALILTGLSLLAIVTDQRSQALAPVRDGMAWALQPVLWAAGLPSLLSDSAERLRSRKSLLAENVLLREKQLVLEARLQRLAALEAENERIRELLESARRLEEKVLIAEVLSSAQDPYRHQIVLNKGTRDGVYRGQALVDSFGVLGQIVQVLPQTSIALLITDPNHGIPVELNRTGLQTIALGRGDGQGLSLPYLPGNADVKVGDLIVSSPLGGRFPAGYPVGQIYELRHTPGEHFMEAIAYPAAKLNQGRQALLVWSESYPVAEAPPPAPAEPHRTPPAAHE